MLHVMGLALYAESPVAVNVTGHVQGPVLPSPHGVREASVNVTDALSLP